MKLFISIRQSAQECWKVYIKPVWLIGLKKRGFIVEIEKPIPMIFEEVKMDCGYRADIVVEKTVVVDAKTIEEIGPLQIAQVLTYLRFLHVRHGLILNFHSLFMKDGIRRVLNGY